MYEIHNESDVLRDAGPGRSVADTFDAGVPEAGAAAPVQRKATSAAGITDELAGFAPACLGGDEDVEGIETEGEDQADQVEAAVRAGKPARAALDGEGAAGPAPAATEAAAEVGHPAPLAAGTAPALKAVGAAGIARKKVALKDADGSRFGTGLTFSKNGFEKGGSYTIWSQGVEIPIPAVPGLVGKFDPGVSVSVKGGVDWKKKAVTTAVGVNGNVGIGFGYGKSELAQIYGVMEAGAGGGFEYSRSQKTWELDGNVKLQTNFKVGVKLGGGILDHSFEFGKCELGTLTGIAWKDGRLQRDKLGWEWGPKPKEFFAALKKMIDKIKKVVNGAGKVVRGVRDGVSSGAEAAAKWVTSW